MLDECWEYSGLSQGPYWKSRYLTFSLLELSHCPSSFQTITGLPNVDYLKAMEAEHCTNACCDRQFTTVHKKTTTPKVEWTIIVAKENTINAHIQSKRQIPDINALEQLELSKQANIRRFEIIAVVLYTGPMVFLFSLCTGSQ